MNRNAKASVSSRIFSAGAGVLLAASLLASEAPKTPTVGFATRHAKSARLADYRVAGPVLPRPDREIPNRGVSKKRSSISGAVSDPAVQTRFGLSQPEASVQFEGASDDDNAAVLGQRTVPPDTEGDVGPDHYVQYINNVAVIYDKSGNTVLGPFPGNAFWDGLGGPCEVQNDGDPLVRYDRQADRWVFSQFALPNFPSGPFYQCVAVSTTNDPDGEYWQYEFKTSDDFFTDYGKIGIWPDAYYMSFNMFGPAGEVQGGAYAFDRGAMLAGAPAGMIIFDTGNQVGVLPSDLDGPTPPPAGSPNYFMTFDVNPARLLEWEFHVDWTTPENSTFTGPVEIPAAEFIYPVCDAFRGQCVPQFETSEKLETLGDRLMYRLVYRNFGDHESLVVNHTVGTEDGSAAPRWYEVRSPGDSPFDLPAGDLRSGRELPLDGLDGDGRPRQHRPRLLQVELDHVPVDRDHGPARRGPARDHGRRGPDVRRRREPGGELEPLGRLQHDVDRPRRRLHVLVHAGVLRRNRRASTSRRASAPSASPAARQARPERSRARSRASRDPSRVRP